MHHQPQSICRGHAPTPFEFHARAGARRIGFTLPELLVTIAVTSVLAAMAIPNFIKLIQSNRLASESNALLSLLTLGRSEAVKRTQHIVLCQSADGITCGAGPATGQNHWMILFADTNADRSLDVSDAVIRSEIASSSADSMIFSAGSSLVYRPDGTSTGGTFTIGSGNIQKKVIVSLAGRARVE